MVVGTILSRKHSTEDQNTVDQNQRWVQSSKSCPQWPTSTSQAPYSKGFIAFPDSTISWSQLFQYMSFEGNLSHSSHKGRDGRKRFVTPRTRDTAETREEPGSAPGLEPGVSTQGRTGSRAPSVYLDDTECWPPNACHILVIQGVTQEWEKQSQSAVTSLGCLTLSRGWRMIPTALPLTLLTHSPLCPSICSTSEKCPPKDEDSAHFSVCLVACSR